MNNLTQRTNNLNPQVTKEPIAIVGISCRFPQANTLQEFWNVLINGVDTVSEMSKERWDIDMLYDPDASAPGKTQQRHGAFLKDIHHFDPFFFNISPAEATEMNPSQKLMLELVWEAIENSTIPHKKAIGTKTGVYIGNIWAGFEHLRKAKNADVTSHSAVGQSANIIANRISYTYGFSGPSLVVDTGCSSSLVALHIACQAIWDGSIEMGVVGGVNHILDPDEYVLLTKFGGLSKKGKCSTFDADADGFVRGEGAGIIIIKPLSRAEADGDYIYAVIRGSAMNNNGFNENLPATSVKGQIDVLEEAYKYSGIKPEEVHYVEAHGTGTKLGDPTETKALGTFFGKNRTSPLAVGSVKTNIGHLEAAAGMAGMIKVILAMQNKVIPKNLNLYNTNPGINFEVLKIKPQTEPTSWPVINGETFKAGINSFGWGGTNAHTIIEEYRNEIPTTKSIAAPQYFLLPLSAKSEQALRELAKAYLKFIEQIKGPEEEKLPGLCAAASITRPEFEYRFVFRGSNKDELIEDLRSFIKENPEITYATQKADSNKTVFIFPGQGSQWLGMGKELYASEPVFRATIDECSKAYAKYTNWNLIDEIHASEENSHISEIDVIQPFICAVQIALAKLWESKGVSPTAVVGHSMGEVAAAYFGGAISLNDAAKIICTRSKLMKTLSGKGGAMAVTELSWDDAQQLVKEYDGKLSVGVYNSPKSTVLSGDQEAISKVLTLLESKNLFCRQVKVDVASHSHQMDTIKEELRQELQNITPSESRLKIYSTVRNQLLNGINFDTDYWVDNLRNTVQFASVIKQLADDGYSVFVEVSPHPVLTTAVKECGEAFKVPVVSAHSTIRCEAEPLEIVKNLAHLYCNGLSVSWEKYYGTTKIPYIQLPTYPFHRERYEIEDKSGELNLRGTSNGHPLLGEELAIAEEEKVHVWESRISVNSLPYIKGHKVNNTIVYPGVAYIESALAAANALFGRGLHQIVNIRFKNTVILGDNGSTTIQLKVAERDAKVLDFKFFSKTRKEDSSYAWTLLADGEIQINNSNIETPNIATQGNTPDVSYTGVKYYEMLQQLGLHYSGYFAGISNVNVTQMSVSAIVSPDENLKNTSGNYYFHPAMLDSCLHTLFAKSIKDSKTQEEKATFLTRIGKLSVLSPVDLGSNIRVKAVFKEASGESGSHIQTVKADLVISQENGNMLAVIEDAEAGIIDSETIQKEQNLLNEWLYKMEWAKVENAISTGVTAKANGIWLVFSGPKGIGVDVASNLQNRGHKCLVFDTCNTSDSSKIEGNDRLVLTDYSRKNVSSLFRELVNNQFTIDGIIYSVATQDSGNKGFEKLTTGDIYTAQRESCSELINIIQALAEYPEIRQPKIAVVTSGLFTISESDNSVNVAQSTLWGVAKVMGNELSANHCLRADLSANPSSQEINNFTDFVLAEKNTECELALRGSEIYAARLSHYNENILNIPKPVFSGNATYLITGFKGLGMVLINWMAERGATNFALLSRSGEASGDAGNQIEALKSKGINIRIFKADVADYEAMTKVFDSIDNEMPSLKGVFHAAGLIEPGSLNKLDMETFGRIISPKTEGAWNLHLLTRSRRLNWFVMFSSASSLIGLSGQASYVAGNTFLDFLANYRKKLKLPALSINWGVMKDVGMVANMAELDKFAKAEGFESITMSDSLKVFEKIANTSQHQMGIFKMDVVQMASYYSALAKTNYFSELLRKPEEEGKAQAGAIESIGALQSDEERTAYLENALLTDVAKLIKTSPSKINVNSTFKSLGIDSIMLVQLRNKLEKDFQTKLSVTTFWTHPSIRAFTAFLYTQIQPLLSVSLETKDTTMEEIKEMALENKRLAKTEQELENMSAEELSNEVDMLLDDILSE
jgi:acyl transferase domain-containing protein/acyl carrier protein